MDPERKLATFVDLLRLSDEVRAEVIHGAVVVSPLPSHSRTLEALRLDPQTGAWIEVGAYDDESVARVAPFAAIELEVGGLFLPRAREV